MQALESKLKALLNTRKPRPIGKETLDELVSQTLSDSPSTASAETRKTQWEYLLRNEILQLAVCGAVEIEYDIVFLISFCRQQKAKL